MSKYVTKDATLNFNSPFSNARELFSSTSFCMLKFDATDSASNADILRSLNSMMSIALVP